MTNTFLLTITLLNSNLYSVKLPTNYQTYRVESSTNQIHWTALETNWDTSRYGRMFIGLDLRTNGSAWYRAVGIN